MKLVNLIPLKEIDFKNQDQFDDYQKKHNLRPDTKVTIDGKPQTVAQATKNSEPVKGSSVFGKDKGGSVFAKTGGASAKSDKAPKTKEISNDDVEALTSYKDFNKFFKANSDKLNKNDLAYIEDEIGALKYLESDYKRGDADWDEVEVAYIELQDLIKKGMSKGDTSTSKSKPFDEKSDRKDFEKEMPKGFSYYSGGTIDGVTAFGDDNGNNVFISDPSVYDDKGNYAVSGYNDDDMTNTNYKVFNDKAEAIAYAKELATKLSGPTKLSSMIPKSTGKAKNKSITDIKVDTQVDVSTLSKSLIPNVRLGDGSGYPDKDAIELVKRLVNNDSGVYTRTSPSGGNIVFKDGTKFEVFRPHDFTKTKSTTIYASKASKR
jgi:hypothetical protein